MGNIYLNVYTKCTIYCGSFKILHIDVCIFHHQVNVYLGWVELLSLFLHQVDFILYNAKTARHGYFM